MNTHEPDVKARFLTDHISLSLKDMKRHRRENQRRASIIKVSMILLSGITTILLGVQVASLEQDFKIAALVFSATVTLLNALEPFFNYRALWIEHEQAMARMYRLKDDVDFYLAGISTEEMNLGKLQEYLERYKNIWDNLNDNYIRYRRSEPQS